MWIKYDYICTDCDALVEITTLNNLKSWRGWCPCGSPNLTNIGSSDATGPSLEPVSNVTPTQVVKINTNPYN
jgi:hypothetical protein